jgi:acetoin utilization protein AcuB
MKVQDLMTRHPQTIGPTDTCAVARELMDKGGFRRLPVVDGGGRLIGIVTDRDLREHAGHLADTRVSGAMVEPAMSVGPDESAEDVAARLLFEQVGGYPVVDASGALVGMITATDLLRGLLRQSTSGPPEERTA